MAAMAMADTAVATMARGLLMPSLRLMLLLRLSPVMVMAVAMAVMAVMVATDVATTARGLLMPSPRLMLLLRPSPVMDMAVATTARGRLRLSLATAMVVMAVDTAAMVATGVATTATARGLLSPAMATAMAGATVAMAATATAGA